jgi:hypothetical protein
VYFGISKKIKIDKEGIGFSELRTCESTNAQGDQMFLSKFRPKRSNFAPTFFLQVGWSKNHPKIASAVFGSERI